MHRSKVLPKLVMAEDTPFDVFLEKTADTLDEIIGCRDAAVPLRQIAFTLKEPFSLAVCRPDEGWKIHPDQQPDWT